ncbi:guanylyl and adenylyl cyclase family member, partial [Volvox carteri f. nagariensis]
MNGGTAQAYSLLMADVQQSGFGGGGGGGGVNGARGSMERSSRLLPLRQAILANSIVNNQYNEDAGDEIEDIANGGVADANHWAASSLLMRTKCNGADSSTHGEAISEELRQSQHNVEGAVAMELVGRRPPRRKRSQQLTCPGPEEAPKHIGLWADFWQQAKQQLRFYKDAAVRKWWILAVPLLLCLLLVGLGVFGVVYAATQMTEQQRDYVRGALASTAIGTVAGQLEIATFAVMTLSAFLTQRPNCTELDTGYNQLASVIFQWDAKQAVYQLQAMPAAVVKYIHPYPNPELAKKLIGRDILYEAQYRNDTIKQIQARDQRLLLGPYDLLEGFKAMFVTYAVFLPAPDPLHDWGCGVQPYKCPPDTCWLPDAANPGGYLKLWGMATSLVRLDVLKEGFGFQTYEEQGYHFRLRQLPDNINREAVIDGTAEPPRDPVTLTFQKYNLQWVFEVAPAAGWVPAWRDPCLAAVIIGSVVVSSLVLWLLLTREKHNLLLRAMLPRKVIRQLQRGEQTVVEEYHDPVTILFTDIVSYTEVASQLTPLQVVRLLNDLYTEFDALTDKHGVYKEYISLLAIRDRPPGMLQEGAVVGGLMD